MHKHMVILQGLVGQNKNKNLPLMVPSNAGSFQNLSLRFKPPSQYSGGEWNFMSGAHDVENI